jgi:soluble lytic murein transglycosylase-like protein
MSNGRLNITKRTTAEPVDGGAKFYRAFALGVGLSLSAIASALAEAPIVHPDEGLLRVAALRNGIDSERYLPRPLAQADHEAYRAAFGAAEAGDSAGVLRALTGIKDRRLVGHVLAEKLLAETYRAPPAELIAWLQKYPDLPDAATLHALAVSRAPKGQRNAIPKPTLEPTLGSRMTVADLGPGHSPALPAARALAAKDKAQATRVRREVAKLIRAADLTGAEARLDRADARRLLSAAEIDHFRTRIAAGLFARDDEDRAYALAATAANSAHGTPRAHWVAGLAAFTQQRFSEAATHFEAMARHPRAHGWDIAAGAFWAGRAHFRAQRFEQVNRWFAVAAEHPRTFYGLLAHRALGHDLPFRWQPPEVSSAEIDQLLDEPAGVRALMLVQVGQLDRAEAELSRLAARASPGTTRALLAVASRASLATLSLQLARAAAEFDGAMSYEVQAYPVPPWRPRDGFTVDPALLYAFMRQESRFNPNAVSPAGARGLMQIMPGTAKIVHGAPVTKAKLLDPVFNLTLGQRYIERLLQTEIVEGDLIKLMASYNAGPGTVAKWKQRRELRDDDTRDDALVAIETMPSPETRHFITRVLYSYWMYSARLGQSAPSLDAIAAGRWPSYVAPVGTTTARAVLGDAKAR